MQGSRAQPSAAQIARGSRTARIRRLWRELWKQRRLQIIVVPFIVYILIFCYVPMYGVVIAFQNFTLGSTIGSAAWVGLRYFKEFFSGRFFFLTLRNTLTISLLKILFAFPAPILFALLLNELPSDRYKKVVQNISYLPYFISWVVIAGLIYILLSGDGPVNTTLKALHLTKSPVIFLENEGLFYPIIVASDIWKDMGYGAIIYLAAISGVDPQIYEAALVDGAGRLRRIVHVTLPSIRGTIAILFIFAVSGMLNVNFDQVYLLQNDTILNVSETIDTFVFKAGITNGNYSYSAAIGLSKSIVGLILLLAANRMSWKLTDSGLF